MDVKDNPSPVSVTTTPLMIPIEKETQETQSGQTTIAFYGVKWTFFSLSSLEKVSRKPRILSTICFYLR